MSAMFAELVKTHCHIGIGDGKYIEVPMLTVKDLNEFESLQRSLAEMNAKKDTTDLQRIDAIQENKKRLIEMAKKSIPEEMHERLELMDYATLSSLIIILCKGKDNAEDDDPSKKVTLPSQLKKQMASGQH